jgi:hypothetical protein
MTNKQTLFFVGQCLTINSEIKNKKIVKKKIISDEINWEDIVKVSSSHFVLPALFCNLNTADLLKYLPKDLVDFMAHITSLNRDRNYKIISQVKEINSYLLKHNITPIFIKGAGNLVEGLYSDIAERMLSDIDFIVSNKEYKKTIKLIKKLGYSSEKEELNPLHRHYPSLVSSTKIASIEIHKDLLKRQYSKVFDYNYIKNNIKKVNGYNVLNYNDQLILSTLSYQINDNGFDLKNVNLRNSYDIFLMSKKINFINLNSISNKCKYMIQFYLTLTDKIFNNVFYLNFKPQKNTEKHLKIFYNNINNPKDFLKRFKKVKKKKKIKYRLNQVKYIISNKEYRYWLYIRLIQKIT